MSVTRAQMTPETGPEMGPGTSEPGAPRAVLITIGDELLFGDIVDSNSAFLGRRCRELGIEVVRRVTVRDRIDEIVAALHEASSVGDIVLTSGGLGPTTDDLTAVAVARAAQVPLARDAETVARLDAFFAARGRALLESNRKQADLPEGCEVLPNPIGTAPGFAVLLPGTGGRSQSTWVASTPGVPAEMKRMMRTQIEPRLAARFGLSPNPRRVYRTLGRGESAVQEQLRPFLAGLGARSPGLAGVIVHYRAHMPEVLVTLEAAPAPGGARATLAELEALDAEVAAALGAELYGVGELALAARLVHALDRAGLRLATAESCTGGRVGAALTELAGVSTVYAGGVVSYTEAAKRDLLEVPAAELARHGAVSEPVARAMAEGALRRFRAELAVAVTGLAGPGGGSAELPVGTLHLALASAMDGEAHTTHRLLRVPAAGRNFVQSVATHAALRMVWDALVERGHARVCFADRADDLDAGGAS